ncbi:MAG: hypothetical protein J5755_03005 [Clostridia bacterium]|nr:hypothetical protein [Clostridia bacterium]
MAYKQDINLFKAAGGERAKAKKMSLTKKLTIVVILVLVVVLGGVGGLFYYNYTLQSQLKKLTTQADNYRTTSLRTTAAVKEYQQLLSQLQAQDAIEFLSMTKPSYFTNMSQTEINAIRNYVESEATKFTLYNDFDEIAEEVLKKLDLEQYNEALQMGDVAETQYTLNFLYGALRYMVSLRDVFGELPLQYTEDDTEYGIWYSYYRGKAVFFFKGEEGADTADAEALVEALRDAATLGLPHSPFATLYPSGLSSLEERGSRYYLINQEDINYLVVAIDCKTVTERFTEVVDDRFDLQMLNVEDPGKYALDEVRFSPDTSVFSVVFKMDQTKMFSIKDVCDAINASEFFHAEDSFAYPTTSVMGEVSAELKFTVVNEAVTAMLESAERYFTIREE